MNTIQTVLFRRSVSPCSCRPARRLLVSLHQPHCSPLAEGMHSGCAAARSQAWLASLRACGRRSPRPAPNVRRNMTLNRNELQKITSKKQAVRSPSLKGL